MKHNLNRLNLFFITLLICILSMNNILAKSTELDYLFTDKELTYIENSPELTVGLKPDRFVMSYYDEENGFGGLNYEIMESLSKISGIKFNYVSLVPGKTRITSINDGDFDLAIAFFDYDKKHNSDLLYFSDSFMENSFELIMKQPNEISLDSSFTIAVPASANSLQDYIKRQYPKSTIVFTSADQRAEEVLKGNVDATIIGRHEAYYILQMPRYRSLSFYPTNIVLGENSIAFSKTQDPILINILNKSINYMMENEFSRILSKSTVLNPYKYTFSDIVRSNFEIILISSLILIFIALLFYKYRNNKINGLKEAAELANKAKSEFISRMTHDMRTPLGAIISFTEFGLEEKSNTVVKEYLEQIQHNSDYLLAIVNDILDIQRIETGKLQIYERNIEFIELIKTINNIITPLANKKKVSYQSTIPEELKNKKIIIDLKLNQKILINILTNALKFTPEGGLVTFETKIVKEDDSSILILYKIKDTGIGMSEEFQKRMYEPFEIENSTNNTTDIRTGLGLSITKNIIDKLGGSISCESYLNKGTSFFIKNNYKKASEQINDSINEGIQITPGFMKSKNILVCEDNKVNQKIISKLLIDEGCKVDLADNGAIGVEMAKKSTYDLIIMDIRMPVMDGYTATSEIKKFNKDIPIIAISANASHEDIKQNSRALLDAYILKPIDRKVFFSTIYKALHG